MVKTTTGKSQKYIAAASFGLALVFFLISCKVEEPTTQQPPRPIPLGIETATEDGKTVSIPNESLSVRIAKGEFDKIREGICGKDDCLKELETYKGELTFNTLVVLTNILVLFNRLNTALNALCSFAREQLGDICPLGAPILTQPQKLEEKQQAHVLDTLLKFVNLDRRELTILMEEAIIALENYMAIQGKENYVFRVTVPFNARIGNLINVWFKEGTEVRYDHLAIFGALSQLVAALLNIINSHDWHLDISGVIGNFPALSNDFKNDPAGLVRRIPGILGLNGAPKFLRFVQGGEDAWKKIPGNLSKFSTWGAEGLDFLFKNPCKPNDPALACWNENESAVAFNLNPNKENIYLGKKTDGKFKLPQGLDKGQVVAVIRDGADKFNCPNNEYMNVMTTEANELDVAKIISAVQSISEGAIKEVKPPNVARIDFCKLFGVKEGTSPLPIRDLLLPIELNIEKNEYKIVEAGSLFAFEAEGTRRFYAEALTKYNSKESPLYYTPVTQDKYYVFAITTVRYHEDTTTFYVGPYDSSVAIYIPNIPANLEYVVFRNFDDVFANWITKNAFNFYLDSIIATGIPDDTVALIVKQKYIQGDYVKRGDSNAFEYLGDKMIKRDYFEPLTTFISFNHVFRVYPDDVFKIEGSISDILGQFGMKAIPQLLLKEKKDGKILNGAVELDNCILVWTVANMIHEKLISRGKKEGNQQLVNFGYFLFGVIINPFVVERIMGSDYLSFLGGTPSPSGVAYLKDNEGICGLGALKGGSQDIPPLPSNVGIEPSNWKFLAATNQILNDFIGIGLFALASVSYMAAAQ